MKKKEKYTINYDSHRMQHLFEKLLSLCQQNRKDLIQ